MVSFPAGVPPKTTQNHLFGVKPLRSKKEVQAESFVEICRAKTEEAYRRLGGNVVVQDTWAAVGKSFLMEIWWNLFCPTFWKCRRWTIFWDACHGMFHCHVGLPEGFVHVFVRKSEKIPQFGRFPTEKIAINNQVEGGISMENSRTDLDSIQWHTWLNSSDFQALWHAVIFVSADVYWNVWRVYIYIYIYINILQSSTIHALESLQVTFRRII